MPIYEEKLISPLAIRFTQQRIRTHFRDGRELEATIKEITVTKGVGDYDIILKAPFPAIEIIRWAPQGRSAGGGEHWFSFDNRRLYCLQRMAAMYWPQRVGAIVEVLYADSGAIRKKLDSQTGGRSVSIGHAFALPGDLKEWNWSQTVQNRAPPGNFTLKAEELVMADDAKANVRELMEAPGDPNLLKMSFSELQTRSCESQGSGSNAAAEGTEEQLRPTGAANASQPEDNDLANLIGQLLDLKAQNLKTQQHSHAHEQASDHTSSTHFPELTESEKVATPSQSGTTCDLESCEFFSDEEDTAEQEQPEPQSAPRDLPAQPTKCLGKKANKIPRSSKMTQQSQAALAARVNQQQMMTAQCQMAQWQMAQWHSAQMAQRQRAALAYQAQCQQAAMVAWYQQG